MACNKNPRKHFIDKTTVTEYIMKDSPRHYHPCNRKGLEGVATVLKLHRLVTTSEEEANLCRLTQPKGYSIRRISDRVNLNVVREYEYY